MSSLGTNKTPPSQKKLVDLNSQTLPSIIKNLEEIHVLSHRDYQSSQQVFETYLKKGCELFGMETGIISQIQDGTYTIIGLQSPSSVLQHGQEFDLLDTLCEKVLESTQTIFYFRHHDFPTEDHPAYKHLFLESYIGTPLVIKGQVFGTLNFSSTSQKNEDYFDQKIMLIELMAQNLAQLIQLSIQGNDLQSSEQRFRTLFEQAPVGISIATVEGVIKQANDAFGNIIGYSPSELMNTPWSALTHPEDLTKNIDLVKGLIAGKMPSVQFEKRYIHKNGYTIWCQLMVTKYQPDTGGPPEILAVIEDVTQRKITEEILKRSEARFRNLFKHAPIGVVVRDRENHMEYVNKHFLDMLGYREEELLGKSFLEFIHKEDVLRTQKALQRVWKQEQAYHHYQKRYFKKDGSMLWCDVLIAIMPDSQMQPNSMVALIKDITAERQANEEIQKLLKMIAEGEKAAKMGTIVWDIRNNDTEASPGILTLFELATSPTPAEFFPTIMSLVHLDDLENLLGAVQEAAKLHSKIDYDFRIVLNNGKIKWIRTTSGSMLDENRMIRTFQDITEEVNQKQKLSQTNQELEELIYTVSHDLRAPLRHVSGYAQMVEKSAKPKLDEEEQTFLENIIQSSKRLGVMIDELLQYSRSRNKEIIKEQIPTKQLVESVQKIFEHETKDRGISWEISELPDLFADPRMMEKVFLNLISNAVKYSSKQASPLIQIEGKQLGDTVQISVKDNGVGFNMKYANKLFAVFQRLHKRRDFEGNGIGLANVQRIIHRHGGKIWAIGEVGKGAQFFISIPIP